jgi:tripartite-type tricarboxylate transporter receptor subunit TctC
MNSRSGFSSSRPTHVLAMSIAIFFGAASANLHSAQGDASDAAAYRSRPSRIIVGFTPGGGPDITARYIAQKLTEAWKQQVVVENRPGAGGTVAAGTAANANPDGHTLLSVSSAHAVAPAIYSKLPYDINDLTGITLTAVSKYLLVAAPASTLRSVKDLVAAAKAKPGQLNFSSAGVGSGTHFAGELLKSMAAIEVTHVPYKGIPEALTDAMTGRVDFFMSPIANAVALVRDGKLRALGVSSMKRDSLLPDLPTIDEAGVRGYESILWFGLLTSTKTPSPVVTRLNAEITRILREDEVRTKWIPIGLEPRPTTPAEFDRMIAEDVRTFTKLAQAGNIKAE